MDSGYESGYAGNLSSLIEFTKVEPESHDSRTRCPLDPDLVARNGVGKRSGPSRSGVVARVNVDDVGDMGMEHVVAESGTWVELIVDDVGDRSRLPLWNALEMIFKPSGHLVEWCWG